MAKSHHKRKKRTSGGKGKSCQKNTEIGNMGSGKPKNQIPSEKGEDVGGEPQTQKGGKKAPNPRREGVGEWLKKPQVNCREGGPPGQKQEGGNREKQVKKKKCPRRGRGNYKRAEETGDRRNEHLVPGEREISRKKRRRTGGNTEERAIMKRYESNIETTWGQYLNGGGKCQRLGGK